MAVRFDQRMRCRPGEAPHESMLTITCEHGGVGGGIIVVNTNARTRDEATYVIQMAIHQMLHRLVADHTRECDCRCARGVLLWCWPNLEARLTVGRLAAACMN